MAGLSFRTADLIKQTGVHHGALYPIRILKHHPLRVDQALLLAVMRQDQVLTTGKIMGKGQRFNAADAGNGGLHYA